MQAFSKHWKKGREREKEKEEECVVTHLTIAQDIGLPHEEHHQETYNIYLDLVGLLQ